MEKKFLHLNLRNENEPAFWGGKTRAKTFFLLARGIKPCLFDVVDLRNTTLNVAFV